MTLPNSKGTSDKYVEKAFSATEEFLNAYIPPEGKASVWGYCNYVSVAQKLQHVLVVPADYGSSRQKFVFYSALDQSSLEQITDIFVEGSRIIGTIHINKPADPNLPQTELGKI